MKIRLKRQRVEKLKDLKKNFKKSDSQEQKKKIKGKFGKIAPQIEFENYLKA